MYISQDQQSMKEKSLFLARILLLVIGEMCQEDDKHMTFATICDTPENLSSRYFHLTVRATGGFDDASREPSSTSGSSLRFTPVGAMTN